MAINVLKTGKKKRTIYKVECPGCGCVYEYNKEDIRQDIMNGVFPQQYFLYTYCPQCHNGVAHSDSNATTPQPE